MSMRGLLGRGLVVTAALAAVAAGGWYFHGGPARKRFEERVAALRAAGQPTRFEDLATPPIPDEENAAKLLEEAHRILEERKDAVRDLLLYQGDRTAEERADLAAYLDSLSRYFDVLERVPERPGWRLDLDWSDGIATRMDYFGHINEARQHVIARIEIDDEEEGRTERAGKAATLLLGLGNKCRGPLLLGYLVAEQLHAEAASILRIAMRRPGFDAALFRRIVDPPLAQAIPERGPPSRVFVEERAWAIAAVEAIAGGADYGYGGEERTVSLFQRPDLYRSGEYMLDVVEMALSRSDATAEDAITAARDLEALPAPKDEWFGASGGMYTRTFRLYADHVANRRLARVVMALLEHRQAKGAWPESLADLGDLPTDPLSGKPFLYERTEHGCRVRAAKEDTDEDLEGRNLLWTLEDDQIPAMAR